MEAAIEYAINAGESKSKENRGRQNWYMGMAILLLGGFSILYPPLFLFAGPQILGLFTARPARYWSRAASTARFVSYGAVFQIAGTGLVPFIPNMGGAVTAMAAMVTALSREHCPGLPVRGGVPPQGDDGGCRRSGNRPGDDPFWSALCSFVPQKKLLRLHFSLTERGDILHPAF